MRLRTLLPSLLLSAVLLSAVLPAAEPSMDRMWGEQGVKLGPANAERGQLLREGHYAMFIHWGLYASLANQWQGKTWYGIGEWIMHRAMAGIPVPDYMALAKASTRCASMPRRWPNSPRMRG